jgi:hypothetical protein
MFIGHFGIGLALKRVTPAVSLGVLFLAAQFVDLLWPTLLLLGIETVAIVPGITTVTPLDFTHYPWSHSLLMGLVWGAAFALVLRATGRDWTTAVIIGAAVLSHWVLDALVHRPDLPLTPLGPWSDLRAGLGVWDSLRDTLWVEFALFGLGALFYWNATIALDRAGAWGFVALLLFLSAIQVGNAFGPPPPSVEAIAWVGQAQWLLVIWGFWLDRHRGPRPDVY